MKKVVLQSMTDFVEEIKRNRSGYLDNDLNRIYKNAEFLKQPVELWMFVPCKLVDSKWIPMEEPKKQYIYSWNPNASPNPLTEEYKEYRQAKERVLFEGWTYFEDNVVEFKTERGYIYLDIEELYTLEDLTENEEDTRVLTPIALKQLGLWQS